MVFEEYDSAESPSNDFPRCLLPAHTHAFATLKLLPNCQTSCASIDLSRGTAVPSSLAKPYIILVATDWEPQRGFLG